MKLLQQLAEAAVKRELHREHDKIHVELDRLLKPFHGQAYDVRMSSYLDRELERIIDAIQYRFPDHLITLKYGWPLPHVDVRAWEYSNETPYERETRLFHNTARPSSLDTIVITCESIGPTRRGYW